MIRELIKNKAKNDGWHLYNMFFEDGQIEIVKLLAN